MTIFRDIKGYEGIYQVSTDGQVLSVITNKLKKADVSNSGYERVCLFKNGKGRHFSIHRLVADAFIPNPNSCEMVNHKDGNKRNNSVDNLEWCNANENMRHAYKNGLINPHTTKVIQYTKDFEKVREWDSVVEASKCLGLNHSNIITVCRQSTNRKYAGGFIWRYA